MPYFSTRLSSKVMSESGLLAKTRYPSFLGLHFPGLGGMFSPYPGYEFQLHKVVVALAHSSMVDISKRRIKRFCFSEALL